MYWIDFMFPAWRRGVAALAVVAAGSFHVVEARSVRVATYNVRDGVGVVGDASYLALRDVLFRMDADIVAFQELQATNRASWEALADELGYPHRAFSGSAPFSGNLFTGYFSRYPILETFNVQSPPGARELTRPPFRAVVEVPGAAAPLVLWTLHHKALTGEADEFRRAVEAYRCAQDIAGYLAAHPGHQEYVVLGDMNDSVNEAQTDSFAAIPSGVPVSYALGADIVFPVAYAVFPRDAYESAGGGMVMLEPRQTGSGQAGTFISNSRRLDYLFVSRALQDSPLGAPESEVYNAALDDGLSGLPKAGPPLAASTTASASDHYPVMADIQMADAWPVVAVPSLRNGGFEFPGSSADAASSWELGVPDAFGQATGSVQRVDWRSRSGQWHAAIMGTWRGLGEAGEYWQEHEAVPGLIYRFSAWCWADEGTSGGVWAPATQFLRLQFYEGGQEVLSVTGALAGVGEAWRRRSVSAMAPPGADRLRVSVAATGVSSGGALQLDDLEIVAMAADTDVDGMPDYWELRHFTNGLAVAGDGDADGDGVGNRDEYIADTAPADPASVLRVLGFVREQDAFRLDWSGGRDAWQYVQLGAMMPDGEVVWTTVQSNAPPTPDEATTAFSITNDVQYIRIRASR